MTTIKDSAKTGYYHATLNLSGVSARGNRFQVFAGAWRLQAGYDKTQIIL